MDEKSLAHSKWECKYHIVWGVKFRRKEIYGKIKADIGVMLREICSHKGVKIIEAEAFPDHIHMLVSIALKMSVSSFMGYLKVKRTDKQANNKMCDPVSCVFQCDIMAYSLTWLMLLAKAMGTYLMNGY